VNFIQHLQQLVITDDGTSNGDVLFTVNSGSNIYIATGLVDDGTAWNTKMLGIASDNQLVYVAAAGGSSDIQTETVILTPSDLQNLHTIPVTLVPAQGAGKVVIVEDVVAVYDYNSVAYTVVGGFMMNVQVNFQGYTTNSLFARGGSSSVLVESQDMVRRDVPINFGENAGIANKPIEISVTNGSLTNGDGTLTITTRYRVFDL